MTGRRLLAAICLVVMAACSDSPPDAAKVETCDDLAGIGIELVDRYLEALVDQPLGVITGDAPVPEEIAELDAASVALDSRVVELGCDPESINGAVVAGIADRQSDDPAGQLLLEVVRGGVDQPMPPPTTQPAEGGS